MRDQLADLLSLYVAFIQISTFNIQLKRNKEIKYDFCYLTFLLSLLSIRHSSFASPAVGSWFQSGSRPPSSLPCWLTSTRSVTTVPALLSGRAWIVHRSEKHQLDTVPLNWSHKKLNTNTCDSICFSSVFSWRRLMLAMLTRQTRSQLSSSTLNCLHRRAWWWFLDLITPRRSG